MQTVALYFIEGLCMSQHTGSLRNGLNLLGEKYLNESHWPMRRIRLLECKQKSPGIATSRSCSQPPTPGGRENVTQIKVCIFAYS